MWLKDFAEIKITRTQAKMHLVKIKKIIKRIQTDFKYRLQGMVKKTKALRIAEED